MSARSIRTLIVLALAAFAVALPASAVAGEVSAVDAVAADTAAGTETTSASTTLRGADSPSTDVYQTGTEKVPPPVDCSTKKGSSGDSSIDSKGGDSTCVIEECSAADTDGKNAAGELCVPIVECSANDADGLNAAGESCTPATCADADVAEGDDVVCGGGEAPVEDASVPEPVDGGGAAPEPEAVGGGAPELPFTGLPLWYAVYGGLALLLFGGTLWARERFGKGDA